MLSRSLPGFALMGLVLAWWTHACSPELVVGKVDKEPQPTDACGRPLGEGGGPAAADNPIDIGWSTGFENEFCDYAAPSICYDDVFGASHETVTEPVHTGGFAAAFRMDSAAAVGQTRCYLYGLLPLDATYEAWIYIPEPVVASGYWNLMYFQGDVGLDPGLWDVSLKNAPDGSLRLYIFGHWGPNPPEISEVTDVPVPIAEWVHVRFHLLRAKDATGTVALYQDGVLLSEATGIVTDRYDVHQWYVGNWAAADALTPSNVTIYVDDVSISAPP